MSTRHTLIVLVLTLVSLSLPAQDKPDWLQQRPITGLSFVGIGMAPKSDNDYMQKAKQNALSDLASEIQVDVQSTSLLHSLEDDGRIKSRFEEEIRLSVQQDIQGYKLIDAWQDDHEYWVYYELNKYDYEAYMKERREKAVKEGFNYWYKGQTALQQGQLITAAELFVQGLEAIRPALNQDLSCSYDGKVVNVGQELHTSLQSLFNGIAITTSVGRIEAEAFQGVAQDLGACLSRNGTALPGMRLQAAFVGGGGDLTPPTLTDHTGTAVFRINNIISKQPNQQVRLTLDTGFLHSLRQGIYASVYDKLIAQTPEAVIHITLKNAKVSAYIEMLDNNISSLAQTVKSILTNNYFNVVATPEAADVTVKISTEFLTGQKVPGELYEMIECFSSVNLQLTDNRMGSHLLDYSVNRLRTLVPGNRSVAQAKQMATRELMKRIQRELAAELKKIHIDTSGSLSAPLPPAESPVPDAEPVKIDVPEPVIIPEVPAEDPKPNQPTASQPQEPIRGELEPGIFIEFASLTHLGDRSMLHFTADNTTDEDYALEFYVTKLLIVNQDGEEVKADKATLGGKTSDYHLKSTIVPGVKTKLTVETKKLTEAALFTLTTPNHRNVKLRNLKP